DVLLFMPLLDADFNRLTRADFSQIELIGIAKIIGSGGDDTIIGSASDDRIDSRSGVDTLTGWLGRDTFLFGVDLGLNHFVDTVTDYEAGVDLFDYTAVTGFEAYADLESRMSEVGMDVIIDLGAGNSVTIQNTLIATLHAHQNDFLF